MARQYVTGPAHLFVGLGTKGGVYLGTAEKFPRISIRRQFHPTYTDQGGLIPHDMAYMGEEAFVAADISRWNESVYAQLAALPRPNSSVGLSSPVQAPVRGTNVGGDIGTLLVGEGMALSLYVQFPYAALKAAIYPDMPPGYRFAAAYLVGPDELEPLGTTPRKERLLWHCLRTYNAKSPTLYTLYDFNLTGLPTPD
jgi:hypothetical protein